MERCLRLGRALINPCYEFIFRNRNHEAEWLVNYSNGVVTISVKPASIDAINISSSECAEDERNIPSVVPEYAQRSCVVEMAPDLAAFAIEPPEEPPIPMVIVNATDIPIETPGFGLWWCITQMIFFLISMMTMAFIRNAEIRSFALNKPDLAPEAAAVTIEQQEEPLIAVKMAPDEAAMAIEPQEEPLIAVKMAPDPVVVATEPQEEPLIALDMAPDETTVATEPQEEPLIALEMESDALVVATELQEGPLVAVEMAPDEAAVAIEPQEEPLIEEEIDEIAEFLIEMPGDPQPRRLSHRAQRLRELCSSQRVRRLRRSFCLSSPSTSSSTTELSSLVKEGAALRLSLMLNRLSQSIPNPDLMYFKNDQINAWINNIVENTGCRRGVAINALFRCNFDFEEALTFVESCIDQ